MVFGSNKSSGIITRKWKLIIALIVIFSLFFFVFQVDKNFHLFANLSIQLVQDRNYVSVPEYDLHMTTVMLSLPVGAKSLELQHELLMCLPEYTEIMLLMPENDLPDIAYELKHKTYSSQIKLIPFVSTYSEDLRKYLVFPDLEKIIYGDIENGLMIPHGTVWTQDLFEVAVKPDGQSLLLISDTYKGFTSYGNKSDFNVKSDNTFIGALSYHGLDIKKLDITFSGGNILIDRLGSRKIAFIGGDVIRKTRTIWKGIYDTGTSRDAKIVNKLRNALNADRVFVMGRENVQPSLMFHLDQAMILLPDNVAGITNIVGKKPEIPQQKRDIEEVEAFLVELRALLQKIGYRVVDIDTSVDNLLNHQHYVNAIPYVDHTTNQKTILMPVFSGTSFEQKLENKNTAVFQSLGYRVIHVPSRTYELNGGIHCLINVIE